MQASSDIQISNEPKQINSAIGVHKHVINFSICQGKKLEYGKRELLKSLATKRNLFV